MIFLSSTQQNHKRSHGTKHVKPDGLKLAPLMLYTLTLHKIAVNILISALAELINGTSN